MHQDWALPQQSTGRSEAAILHSLSDCVTLTARIVLTLVSLLQAWSCLWQSLISASLKHATVNLVSQDVIFVLCKCVYLWFTEELKLICTFPLSSLYLSSLPPVFLQSIFLSKEFGFFPLTGEINNLGPRSVSWDRPVGKHLSRDFLFPVRDLLAFLIHLMCAMLILF